MIHDAAGNCAVPEVERNILVFAAPPRNIPEGEKPEIPTPKINYNIVFVKTPEAGEGEGPIVVPPPQQKTLVYVLSKKPEGGEQGLIEVPFTPQSPEVYYVNYADGENPNLPGGIDLQTALASVPQQEGQNVGGGNQGGFNGGHQGGSNGGNNGFRPQRPSSTYGTP